MTVWKFQEFFITQIFRQINATSAKSPIFKYLESLKFGFYEFLPFLKVEIYHINKIHSPKKGKVAVFEILDSPNLISRKM